MTQRALPRHPSHTCGTFIRDITVEEEAILNASRVLVLITASCSNGHQSVLFVDRNFQIREAEPIVQETKSKKSAIDKGKG